MPNKKYRFHSLGLAHLPVNNRYTADAYTQKIYRMAQLLTMLGHEVFLYAAEDSNAPCTELIETHSLADIRAEWGDGFDDSLGYDWRNGPFRHDFESFAVSEPRRRMLVRAADAIKARMREDDFLLLPLGDYHDYVMRETDLYMTCEPGVGYPQVIAPFAAFESRFVQAFVGGMGSVGEWLPEIEFYDRVIPNPVDSAELPFQPRKSDYYLFVGRLIEMKGLDIAIETVEAVGGKLLVAGVGDYRPKSPNVEYIGYLDAIDRATYMGCAKALLAPTRYQEPFGLVVVEAQMCGTPVITTNGGAFPELIQQGVTGFCCNTLQDFVNAARGVESLDPVAICDHGMQYDIAAVAPQFENWFDDLYDLNESANDPTKLGWHRLRG